MSNKSLGNPYDSQVSLIHTKGCDCAACMHSGDHKADSQALEQAADQPQSPPAASSATDLSSPEDYLDLALENAIVRAMFNHNDASRRRFLRTVGGSTFAAALASVLPMDAIKAAAQEAGGPLEKKKLNVGFVPITC